MIDTVPDVAPIEAAKLAGLVVALVAVWQVNLRVHENLHRFAARRFVGVDGRINYNTGFHGVYFGGEFVPRPQYRAYSADWEEMAKITLAPLAILVATAPVVLASLWYFSPSTSNALFGVGVWILLFGPSPSDWMLTLAPWRRKRDLGDLEEQWSNHSVVEGIREEWTPVRHRREHVLSRFDAWWRRHLDEEPKILPFVAGLIAGGATYYLWGLMPAVAFAGVGVLAQWQHARAWASTYCLCGRRVWQDDNYCSHCGTAERELEPPFGGGRVGE